MFSVKKCPVPANTMLARYSTEGAYVDCYSTEVQGNITFPEFIFAFYTTFLFKLERAILAYTISKPSTDHQAKQLADGDIRTFAAWSVESQNENELLMCDFRGRTRSWLMLVSVNTSSRARARLYFGSAVVPVRSLKTGKLSLGWAYRSLLAFHKIYSVLLLGSTRQRLERQIRNFDKSADSLP